MMNHEYFAKKIPGYFDGTLRDSERTEFEAYVGTHADFATYFRQKEADYQSLRLRIPNQELSMDAQERLEVEIKEVINNLFQDDEATMGKRLGNWFKEKL
jgi:anti-sigma factor RsiW